MTPFYYDLTPSALAELSAAGEYVRFRQGDEAAERFSERVSEAITASAARLAQEIADNATGKPFDAINPDASVHWSQPVYRLRIETGAHRARRSSAGLWYLYYTLLDAQKTGKPNTMLILSLRHSAARPLGEAGDAH